MKDPDAGLLVGTVLHELVTEAEGLLLVAHAIDEQTGKVSPAASPQKLREAAALLKSAALQCGLTAAHMVGAAERLRLIAEFLELAPSGGDLPS
jgi:hypothetical protein